MNEKGEKTIEISRKNFIQNSAIAATAITIVPRHVLVGVGFTPPSGKLLIAGIGVGGKVESDLTSFHANGNAEIAFLCDVDDRRAENSRKRFPKAKY